MRHRVGAASFAVLGGLLVVATVFIPQWWAGPIHIAGRVIHGKTVHVSMLRSIGCNAGDGTCVGLDVDVLFRGVGILSMLVASVTSLISLGLALKAWRRATGAVTWARLAMIGAVFAIVGGAVFLALLPERFEGIPGGWSPYGYFTGTAAVVLASLLALRGYPVARVEEGPVDVRELLSTDMLRPANLGPEPKLGRHGAVHSDEPTGPPTLGPRFRPLYEVQGYQGVPGGAPPTGGYQTHLPTAPIVMQDPLSDPAYQSGYLEPSSSPAREPLDVGGSQDHIETESLAPVTERADALPAHDADPSWQVDPPQLGEARPSSASGVEPPTLPNQRSSGELAATHAEPPGNGDVNPVDSGVFLRKDAPLPRGSARVPTATTSASLAALAALSKPAVITMAPAVARKMASGRGTDSLAAVAPAVAPACPNCEDPMEWADKHHRYYCTACRVYF
ncbi:MAG: hypothetical protein R3B48_29690 [Kofleriaceae bacterium]